MTDMEGSVDYQIRPNCCRTRKRQYWVGSGPGRNRDCWRAGATMTMEERTSVGRPVTISTAASLCATMIVFRADDRPRGRWPWPTWMGMGSWSYSSAVVACRGAGQRQLFPPSFDKGKENGL